MRYTAMLLADLNVAATPYTAPKMYFQEQLLFACVTNVTSNAGMPETAF